MSAVIDLLSRLHHCDRGSRYSSERILTSVAGHGVVRSTSRSGNIQDNAAKASFFSSPRMERMARKTCRTGDEAKADAFEKQMELARDAVNRTDAGHSSHRASSNSQTDSY